jgi:2-methylisocitrate lyase-like PEP mutase family enzyme
MPSVAEKRRVFRERHESGCFVRPNPWDIGGARYLQHLGFKAVATTSAGTFNGFAEATPHAELNGFFRDDAKQRRLA